MSLTHRKIDRDTQTHNSYACGAEGSKTPCLHCETRPVQADVEVDTDVEKKNPISS